jgi:hypothetical protein
MIQTFIATLAVGLAAYGLIWTTRQTNAYARDAERYRHATSLYDQSIVASMNLVTGRTAIVHNITFDVKESKTVEGQTVVTGTSSTGHVLTATVWPGQQ